MGSQLSCQTTYSVLLIGLEGSGKSTYVQNLQKLLTGERLYSSKDNTPPPTTTKMTPIQLPGQLLLFEELGGNKRTMDNWDSYFKLCQQVIWMIDSTDSLKAIDESIKILVSKLQITNKQSEFPLLYNKPILILLNKENSYVVLSKPGDLTKEKLTEHVSKKYMEEWKNSTGNNSEPNDYHLGWTDALNGTDVVEWAKWVADELDYKNMSRPAKAIKSIQSFELPSMQT